MKKPNDIVQEILKKDQENGKKFAKELLDLLNKYELDDITGIKTKNICQIMVGSLMQKVEENTK